MKQSQRSKCHRAEMILGTIETVIQSPIKGSQIFKANAFICSKCGQPSDTANDNLIRQAEYRVIAEIREQNKLDDLKKGLIKLGVIHA